MHINSFAQFHKKISEIGVQRVRIAIEMDDNMTFEMFAANDVHRVRDKTLDFLKIITARRATESYLYYIFVCKYSILERRCLRSKNEDKNCILTLIPDGFCHVWHGFRLAPLHVTAVPVTGCDVFINPVIALDKLSEAEILQLAVSFGRINAGPGNQFVNRTSAFWATGKGGFVDGLHSFEYFAQVAGVFIVFIFINGHIFLQSGLALLPDLFSL